MSLSTVTHLFSPQGVIMVAPRDAVTGVANKFTDLGNAPKLAVSLKIDVEELKESTTGQRLPMARLEKAKSAEVSMSLHNFDKRTLQLLLRSASVSAIAGSVTDELTPTGLVAGDIVRLAHPFVSAVVVTDSTGTPQTVDATHYQLDADGGVIRFTNVGTFVQPFKIDYSYAAAESTPMMTLAAQGYTLLFTGVNTAEGNDPVVVELYNVVFDPASNIDLITDNVTPFELKGSMLIDSFKSAGDTTFGQFGRIVKKAA